MKIKFEINNPGEPDAGYTPFSETINVEVESGDPGGEKREFEQDLARFLADWFNVDEIEINGESFNTKENHEDLIDQMYDGIEQDQFDI